jgi:hypothetical protein
MNECDSMVCYQPNPKIVKLLLFRLPAASFLGLYYLYIKFQWITYKKPGSM